VIGVVVVITIVLIIVILIAALYCVRKHHHKKSEKFAIAYYTKNGTVEVPFESGKFGKQ